MCNRFAKVSGMPEQDPANRPIRPTHNLSTRWLEVGESDPPTQYHKRTLPIIKRGGNDEDFVGKG